jgi:hypothetical protein
VKSTSPQRRWINRGIAIILAIACVQVGQGVAAPSAHADGPCYVLSTPSKSGSTIYTGGANNCGYAVYFVLERSHWWGWEELHKEPANPGISLTFGWYCGGSGTYDYHTIARTVGGPGIPAGLILPGERLATISC